MLGNIIGAGASLLGGILGQNQAEKNAERNIAMQREFAQQGIRWKVADAKAAGIHPLYALGANTTSFSPVSVGTPLASSLASMGQDVGRAINATTTTPERVSQFAEMAQKLQLDNMALQNQLLASKLATQNQVQSAPPIPSLPGGYPATETPIDPKLEGQNRMIVGNTEIRAHPGWTPANVAEDQWGETMGSVYGIPKSIADLWNHFVTTHPDVAANMAVQRRYHRARREGYPIGHRHWRE